MAEGGGSEPGTETQPATSAQSLPVEHTVPDQETQRLTIGDMLKMPLKKGDEWYLIDSRWFKQWKKFVGFDSWDMYSVGDCSYFPGPVDNSGLFADQDTQALKEHLIDELDYVLLPTEAWNKLVSWYSCVEGQKPIIRKDLCGACVTLLSSNFDWTGRAVRYLCLLVTACLPVDSFRHTLLAVRFFP
ncbi:ubiquitin carboxyl-terminal hydrolase 4-like [Protopterus annectens]|uniref:ubiquitin carboxyl-terminal hydrolase 4-like n=1 Tax=Protopterus annectens TaxID=7888 RepID=UPI001CF9A311|nr:ubiquitin carboxyl-terminal hydrolase 4-like [Protopterus annectens]